MNDKELLDSLIARFAELQEIQIEWLEFANSGQISIEKFSEYAFSDILDFKGMTEEMHDLILRIEVLLLKNKNGSS